MICPDCGFKMKCTYTAPQGGLRYRVYKCFGDNKYQETVEVPVQALDQIELMQKRLEEARTKRFGIIKRLKR